MMVPMLNVGILWKWSNKGKRGRQAGGGGVKKEMGGVGMLLWGGLEKGRGVEKIRGGGQKKGEPETS